MKWWKILIGVVAIVIGLPLLYLLLWPVPIDPIAWTPPPAPELAGMYEPNTRLTSVEKLGVGAGMAPEDVAVDGQGRIYGGMKDGRILRYQPDGSAPEIFADTGGRPLGLHFDAAGNLVVADSFRGLISVAPSGAITTLSTEAAGAPINFADDVDIAADGIIYFSDASSKFKEAEYELDLYEHRPNGRLLAYDPSTQTTRLVLDKLYFANGVAVSPDQSFVLVVETWKYRVQRYWLTGPRQGEAEVFVENLPGFPDGISSNGKDTFWITMIYPRNEALDTMMLPNPFMRKLFLRLPKAMRPAPEFYGLVLGLDMDGRVVHNLQDPAASYRGITSVQEHEGMLYLGSIHEDSVGRVPVP